jgi:hypothetical protein
MMFYKEIAAMRLQRNRRYAALVLHLIFCSTKKSPLCGSCVAFNLLFYKEITAMRL